MAEVRSSFENLVFFHKYFLELGAYDIFAKAGEEWTTIAKTKGKKKTKPEDEWQEVKFTKITIFAKMC